VHICGAVDDLRLLSSWCWTLSTAICNHSITISIRYVILGLIVAGTAVTSVADAAPVSSDQKRVLVIYSTRRDSLITEAAERILAQHLEAVFGVQFDYYTEYIDPARFPDADYNSFGEFIRQRYPQLRPNIVIAVEDAAVGFVTRNRQALFADTPIVFFTRDAAASRLPNSTGVIEPIDFARTIELVTALQPDVTEIVVVSGSSARDRAYEAAARAQFQPFAHRLTFTYLSGLPIADLERRLTGLPATSVVYPLLVSQAGDGNFRPREINSLIPQIANRPTYGWHERHHGDGYVGGSLLQLAPGLTLLAERAVRVLSGEAAGTIEVARPQRQVDRVDWRQLQRWGISESRVPAGVAVDFRDTTIWQRYRTYVIGAGAIVVAQSALIVGLLIQARRRRQAERELRSSQQQLTRSVDRIRDIGGRLLTAQEGERSRIARELHDDISQQLAVLALELRKSDGRASAVARISDIARSVRELSHRLHPANLKVMGLVGSLSALQQEYLRAGLPVRFAHADVPDTLSPELSLCIFRVVQETLQNVAKHSGASEVSVDLRRDNGGLLLTVTDNGVGFDVEKVWDKGLGLISIRERVEASGGTAAVESHPGKGTRFVIDVPI
jgi:signal transduction histidine kinase